MKKYTIFEMKQFGFFRIAGAVPELRVADVDFNLRQYLSIIELAKEAQINFLVFPDLSLTGITCEDLFLQEKLLEKVAASVEILRKALKQSRLIILFTIPQRVNNRICKMLYLLSERNQKSFILPVPANSSLKNFYPSLKYSLDDFTDDNELNKKSTFYFKQKSCRESFHFAVYQSLQDFQLNYAQKIAPCALNIILSESPEISPQNFSIKKQISTLADLSQSCILYISPPFGESTTDFVYAGRSYIVEKNRVLAQSTLFESDLMIADIDLELLQKNKFFQAEKYSTTGICIESSEFLENIEKIEDYSQIFDIELHRPFPKNPFLPDNENLYPAFFESLLNTTAHALVKRLQHINDHKIILGLSGGSDSTMALLIAIRAEKILGQKNKQILCVSMPGFGTTKRTFDNSKNLATACGAKYLEIKIHDVIARHFQDIEQNPDKHDITYENAQARERTQILMDLANQRGGIVLGTGDLSESALGFATYGGDHLAMYNINAGIPKTLLRYLIKYEAERYSRKSDSLSEDFSKTLFDVLNTPVSPELLPPKDNEIAQKTENIVGPYELHDYFLYYFINDQFSPRKILFMAEQAFSEIYEPEIILHWLKLFIQRFFNNQFKRCAMPDGPAVLDISLSPRKGFLMPSDTVSKIWLEDLEKIETLAESEK